MPRCNSTWVRKGKTAVTVTVTDPPEDQTVVLRVAFVPLRLDLPVLPPKEYGKQQLVQGARWTTPLDYRAIFTMVTTGQKAINTGILLNDEKPSCAQGAHCYGPCKPSGEAGVAGSWAVTTWGGES